MIPIRQTQFEPDYKHPKAGNCFAACVASILGESLDAVPNFVTAEGDWLQKASHWLSQKYGFVLLDILLPDGSLADLTAMADGIWCIISGKSPRGDFIHSIVGRYRHSDQGHWLQPEHDPHPDSTAIDGKPTAVTFFIKVDPSR